MMYSVSPKTLCFQLTAYNERWRAFFCFGNGCVQERCEDSLFHTRREPSSFFLLSTECTWKTCRSYRRWSALRLAPFEMVNPILCAIRKGCVSWSEAFTSQGPHFYVSIHQSTGVPEYRKCVYPAVQKPFTLSHPQLLKLG